MSLLPEHPLFSREWLIVGEEQAAFPVGVVVTLHWDIFFIHSGVKLFDK